MRESARAHLAYAHEHSIIHNPAACRCVSHRVLARSTYARKHSRDTARAQHTALARDSRACQPSPRIRPGQNRSGGSTGDRKARARLYGLGGAGRGALISPGGRARGAGQRRLAPLPTLVQAEGADAELVLAAEDPERRLVLALRPDAELSCRPSSRRA